MGRSTNEEDPAGPAGRAVPHEQPGPDARPENKWEKIYAPKVTDGVEGADLEAKRHLTKGAVRVQKFRGRPNAREEATVPFEEALPVYRESAEKAIEEGAVPPEYQESVRRYFESLK